MYFWNCHFNSGKNEKWYHEIGKHEIFPSIKKNLVSKNNLVFWNMDQNIVEYYVCTLPNINRFHMLNLKLNLQINKSRVDYIKGYFLSFFIT